jgi:hypothetical protein
MTVKAAVRRMRRREKGQETGKHPLLTNCRHNGTGFYALKYLSVGSTRAR